MHKHHIEQIVRASDTKALILIHGRGSTAKDILGIASELSIKNFSLYAPQATNRSWYPLSFLATPELNEPWLESAIDLISLTIKKILEAGISREQIYFLGFSQGACLAVEFITRNASRYGGAVILTGGLIGDRIYPERYQGHFENTPIFLATSDPDIHVPVQRVNQTAEILIEKGAKVNKKIYANMGHIITEEEIMLANELIFNL
ncbi:alpha/beta hydrolase [Flavobacterium sp. 3-210]